jgi:erythromycin esterase
MGLTRSKPRPGPSQRPRTLKRWMRAQAIPIRPGRPGLFRTAEDGRRFEHSLGPARIVGLGEATHGSREFFEVRQNIVEFLVQRHDFRVVALEADWLQVLLLNEYVQRGTGSAAGRVRTLTCWPYASLETVQLAHWLRAHNASRPWRERIRLYGIDITSSRRALGLLDREPASCNQAGRLNDADSPWALGNGPHIRASIERHARIVSRARLARRPIPFAARERAMAENLQWILRKHGGQVGVVIWAHNRHIAKRLEPQAPDGAPTSLGSHLRRRFGRGYFSVGFVFNRGEFRAVDARDRTLRRVRVGPEPSFGLCAALPLSGGGPWLFPLRGVAIPPPIRRWLDSPQWTRDIGAIFDRDHHGMSEVCLLRRYDAFVLLDRVASSSAVPCP